MSDDEAAGVEGESGHARLLGAAGFLRPGAARHDRVTSSFCIQNECIFLMNLDGYVRLPALDGSGWPLVVSLKSVEKLVGHVGIGSTTNPEHVLIMTKALGAALIDGAKAGDLDHLLRPLL